MLCYKNNTYILFAEVAIYRDLQAKGWKWHKESEAWYTKDRSIVEKSKRFLSKIDLKIFNDSEPKANLAILESSSTTSTSFYPCNGLTPFGYQLAGVDYLIKRSSALIADEMGLGKTMQTILFMNVKEIKNVVVVCPASLKNNWREELIRWGTLNNSIGIASGAKFPGTDIVIINYDILARHRENIIKKAPELLVMDEAHYLKNNKAQRTKALFGEWQKSKPIEAKYKIAITGTPIPNRPIEMFALLKFLDPITFNNKEKFAKRFCDAGFDANGRWTTDGASNLDELNNLLRSTLMLRRMKKDVLKQLPDKIRQIVYLDADDMTASLIKHENGVLGRDAKGLTEQEFIDTIRSLPRNERSNLLALRKDAGLCKVSKAVEHIKEMIESGYKKVLVFAHHKEVIKGIMGAFEGKAVKIDGSVDPDKRQALVHKFNSDDSLNVFVGQLQAAGVGLNLTSAELVIFVECGLNPGEVSQCEDRAHRIGQKKNVLVQHLILQHSIDEVIAKMVIEKQAVIDKGINYKTGTILEGLLE